MCFLRTYKALTVPVIAGVQVQFWMLGSTSIRQQMMPGASGHGAHMNAQMQDASILSR